MLIELLGKERLHSVKRAVSATVIRASRPFLTNHFFSSIYSFASGNPFSSEAKAALAGRVRYVSAKNKNYSLLRRNIHRLEKGLVMRPLKQEFASEYIVQTVRMYHSQFDSSTLPMRAWANDVLREYFSTVIHKNGNIRLAKEIFDKVASNKNFNYRGRALTPMRLSERKANPISYEQLDLLCRYRKSVRDFSSQEVEVEKLKRAIEIASLAPSACNRQPFVYYVVNGHHNVQDVAKLAMGTAGFSDGIPCLLAVVGDLSCSDMTYDRHVSYIDASLASMQLLLALETLGLSTCVLNWPDIRARNDAIAKRLGLQSYQRVIFLIAVGYANPTASVPYSCKKAAEELMVILQ